MSGIFSALNGGTLAGVRPYSAKEADCVSHDRDPQNWTVANGNSDTQSRYYIPHRVRETVTFGHLGIDSAVSDGSVIATGCFYDEDGTRLLDPVDITADNTGYVRSEPFQQRVTRGQLIWIGVCLVGSSRVYNSSVFTESGLRHPLGDLTLDMRKVGSSFLHNFIIGKDVGATLPAAIDLTTMVFQAVSPVTYVEAI